MNMEKRRASQRRYATSEKGRERRRRADAKYNGTIKGIERYMRWTHKRRNAAIEREVAQWL